MPAGITGLPFFIPPSEVEMTAAEPPDLDAQRAELERLEHEEQELSALRRKLHDRLACFPTRPPKPANANSLIKRRQLPRRIDTLRLQLRQAAQSATPQHRPNTCSNQKNERGRTRRPCSAPLCTLPFRERSAETERLRNAAQIYRVPPRNRRERNAIVLDRARPASPRAHGHPSIAAAAFAPRARLPLSTDAADRGPRQARPIALPR
jgi:hypothetical protein